VFSQKSSDFQAVFQSMAPAKAAVTALATALRNYSHCSFLLIAG
jgi:hypothetical protein